MSRLLLTVLSLLVTAGCTTPALERHTINQALSITEIRYREVMHGLAVVANNAGAMPSVALNTGGLTTVTNTLGIESATTWDQAVLGFSKQLLNASGKHNPMQQWTVAPVAAEPNLSAIYAAFLWPIYGPPPLGSIPWERLRAPNHYDSTGLHFDVEKYLRTLPPDWLKRGSHHDVPANACYSSHCGDTYVWVRPDGMWALSEFTLVVMDIATTDPQSIVYQQPLASVDMTNSQDGDQQSPYTVTETRAVQLRNDGAIIVHKTRLMNTLPTLVPGTVGLSQLPPLPRATSQVGPAAQPAAIGVRGVE